MNGDMSCIVCEKTIPRAVELSHMIEAHGWDYDKYRDHYWRGPERNIREFEGYNPMIISSRSNPKNMPSKQNVFFLLSTAVALYFSTEIAIGIIALQIFLIWLAVIDQKDVDDSLNGMVEQLRLRISDLEEKLEDKRIPPII